MGVKVRVIKSETCLYCSAKISRPQLVCHVRASHKSAYEELKTYLPQAYLDLSHSVCSCGKLLSKIPERFDNSVFLHVLTGSKINFPKVCSRECIDIWNRGKTKETDERLQAIADGRMGENNPIHKVVADQEAYASWCHNVKEGSKEYQEARRGLSFEEWLGEEKAVIVKAKMSYFQSNRSVEPHKGHKHNQETKDRLAELASEQMRNLKRKPKTSKPQLILYKALSKDFDNITLEKEIGVYRVDIAIGDVAIEVDGDFFHVNEATGFTLKYPVQKRNLINDAKKNTFLASEGYRVIRVWESEIKNDLVDVVNRIKSEINV